MEPTVYEHPLNGATARLFYGVDVREGLRALPGASVHTICTSPPYWGLRDYGLPPSVWGGEAGCGHEWHTTGRLTTRNRGNTGLRAGKEDEEWTKGRATEHPSSGDTCRKCGAWRGNLGLEPTPQLYVEHLVEVFREAARVLRPDGTLWLNLGDTYCSTAPGTMGDPLHRRGVLAGVKETTAEARRKYRPDTPPGLKPKDLVGIPWRMAFALQDAGWYLRNDIVWSKSSCMPESVRDRCTRSHEYVFLFAHPDSGGRYFYDAEAIREPVGSWAAHDRRYATQAQERVREDEPAFQARRGKPVTGLTRKPMTSRNRRSVWQVNPKPYKGAHFAVWPAKLVDPMVRAGSSQKGACEVCGAPHRRWQDAGTGDEWGASCGCGAGTVPCTVLDPFSGSATTGKVALGLGRDYVGIDLSEANLSLAQARLEGRAAPSAEADDAGALISDLFGDDE